MIPDRMRMTGWLVMAALAGLLGGCAAPQTVTSSPVPAADTPPAAELQGAQGWWSVSFSIDWPEDTEPTWFMGPLLAREIVAPVLAEYGSEIQLWRIHRRAARDSSGHRFTFHFYTTSGVAERIMTSIRYNEIHNRLTASGDIVRTDYSDPRTNLHPHVEDISDRHWTPALQKAWPYFMMGASAMWLDLIDEIIAEQALDKGSATLAKTKEIYQDVEARIVKVWQDEGRHAFLHHLNAIFEYQPLWVYERRPMQF